MPVDSDDASKGLRLRARGTRTPVEETPAQTRTRLALAAARADLAHCLELFAALEAAHGDTIALLRLVAQLAVRPADQWEAGLRGVRAEQTAIAQALLCRVAMAPPVGQKVAIAVHRFDAAAGAVREASEALDHAATQPPEAALGILAGIDPPKIKGKLYAVTTYDALFAGVPVLTQMFPPQARDARARLQAPKAAPLPAPAPPAKAAQGDWGASLGEAAVAVGDAAVAVLEGLLERIRGSPER